MDQIHVTEVVPLAALEAVVILSVQAQAQVHVELSLLTVVYNIPIIVGKPHQAVEYAIVSTHILPNNAWGQGVYINHKSIK